MAFILTVVLAFVPEGKSWGITVSVVLVLAAGLLELGAAWVFDKAGRADPSLVKTAFGHLVLLAAQARRARVDADRAFEAESGTALKASIGKLTVHLSYIEEGIAISAQDWALFHPDATARLAEEDQGEGEDRS